MIGPFEVWPIKETLELICDGIHSRAEFHPYWAPRCRVGRGQPRPGNYRRIPSCKISVLYRSGLQLLRYLSSLRRFATMVNNPLRE